MSSLIVYNTPGWVTAFTTGKGCGVEDVGLSLQQLALPRQTHSDHILRVTQPGRPEDTDAVITSQPGLCVCVKTADCIPVLLYDDQERQVAAVHAGWRGTVARIAEKAIQAMAITYHTKPEQLHCVIGPGISLDNFEVGQEVYEQFAEAGFDMDSIAKWQTKWHIDLKECNRQQLVRMGVKPDNIEVSNICTVAVNHDYFSARKQGINSGRIFTGALIY